MLTPGHMRYVVVSLATLAGVLAAIGGGWFEGS
jgi:hypothetical protein